MNHPKDLWRLMRPLQWIKNGFVFTGFIFSGEHDLALLIRVFLTFAAFCLMSSSAYVVNDLFDVEFDKKHPQKKFRPIPSGKVSKQAAIFLAIVLGAAGFIIGSIVSPLVLAILGTYVLINFVYSLWLKNIVVIDVFCISAGFMLRILAGTIGVGISPSNWLLLCGMMITLFLGFAKRRAEIISLQGQTDTRKVLHLYGPVVLDEFIAISATCVILSYSLYTVSANTIQIHHTENLIYTVPFVIYALFRYIYMLHHCNSGGEPTRDLVKDPHIIVAVLGWSAMILYFLSL